MIGMEEKNKKKPKRGFSQFEPERKFPLVPSLTLMSFGVQVDFHKET
jgi:hypothetical protein